MAREMVFGESGGQIEVAAGRYVARFTGTEDREPFKESRFGTEGEGQPRMAWLFEIAQGAERGRRIVQETGCKARLGTNAWKMIDGLAGGTAEHGQRVDVDQYIGRLYTVKVAVNPKSDKGNLHIEYLEPYQGDGSAAPAPAPLPRAPRPAGARPAPEAPPAPRPQRYLLDDGHQSRNCSWQEVADEIQSMRRLGRDLAAVQVAKAEHPNVWQTLAEAQGEFLF
jgi:hypothetical protein